MRKKYRDPVGPPWLQLSAEAQQSGPEHQHFSAAFWGVTVKTFYNWQKEHPGFLHALKEGKEKPDAQVERSLFERATGYTHDAVKILQYEGQPVIVPYTERYPPDSTSMIFWLKNRRPDRWRDKSEVEVTGDLAERLDRAYQRSDRP